MTFPSFSEPWPEPIYTGCWRRLFEEVRAGRLDPRSDVLPVRISRGVPRFWPEAARFPTVPELTPDGWMLGIKDDDRFDGAYRAKLHRIGFERIEQALGDLLIAYCRPLVLCCFEPAEGDRAPHNCHRGPEGFGGWWMSQGGAPVPEWPTPPLELADHYETAPATGRSGRTTTHGGKP